MTDLSERICVVTGATRGIGRATAEALANLGATVVLHGRDPAALESACGVIAERTGNPKITGVTGRLDSLDDVRRMADEIAAQNERIDVLVNNAGTSSLRRRTTADGFEWQLGVNHLAPFLLTNLLMPRLAASGSARIVNVSSGAHRRGAIDFDDLNWERRKYSGLQAYSDSKLANILFTRELAARLQGTSITTNALHPGVVATNIFSTMGVLGKIFGVLARPWLLSPEAGAATSVYLASSMEVADVTGRYFNDSGEATPTVPAQDSEAAKRLWDASAEMTGLPPNAPIA